MSKKLFVGGLAWATTDEGLHNAFSAFGNIIEAKVICDRETGRSRGFGFITFEDEASAEAARTRMHGTTLDGRTIRIDSADNNRRDGNRRPRNDRPRKNIDRGPRNDNRYENAPRNDRNDRNDDGYDSAPRNEWNDRSRQKHDYSNDDFGYFPSDPPRGGRDGKRRDRKKGRNTHDDDDRW